MITDVPMAPFYLFCAHFLIYSYCSCVDLALALSWTLDSGQYVACTSGKVHVNMQHVGYEERSYSGFSPSFGRLILNTQEHATP
jgi:hypothetical protein